MEECEVYFLQLNRAKCFPMQKIENCKICQSRHTKIVKKYNVNSSQHPDLKVVFGDGLRISVGLRLCLSCGFVFHDNILSLSELEKVYLQEDRITHKKDGIQKKKLLSCALGFLHENFNFSDKSNVIDIGSGDFSLLDSLSTDYPTVLFDAVNVSYKDSTRGKIRVFHTMLEDMTNSDSQYRLVILSHILEHVADFNKFFESLKKITTTETQLYVEVPFQVGPGILLNRGFHAQHINYFTPQTLEFLMEKFGYKMDNIEFDTKGGYYYYGIPGVIRAKFSYVPQEQYLPNSIKSVMSSLFYFVDPTIYIAGRLRTLLFQKII